MVNVCMVVNAKLDKDVDKWLEGKRKGKAHSKFSDPYVSKGRDYVTHKWSGLKLSEKEAKELEGHLVHCGHNIHFVRPDTKPLGMHRDSTGYYTGFRVIERV